MKCDFNKTIYGLSDEAYNLMVLTGIHIVELKANDNPEWVAEQHAKHVKMVSEHSMFTQSVPWDFLGTNKVVSDDPDEAVKLFSVVVVAKKPFDVLDMFDVIS